MKESTPPKVSVLMPVFNAEKYLRAAIDSILSQTFTDFELIIVNDGSTDGSDAIIRSYDDPRITYVVNEQNRGVVFSRNRALFLARGEFLASMDADDICLPERLQRQVAYLETHNTVGACGSSFKFSNGRIRHVSPYGNVLIASLAFGNCFAASTVMMRRQVLDAYSLGYNPELSFAEDYDLWLQIARFSDLGAVEDILVYYRIDQNSLSHSVSKDMRANSVISIKTKWYEWIIGRSLSSEETLFLRGEYSEKGVVKSGWKLIREVVNSKNSKIDPAYYLSWMSGSYETILVRQLKSFSPTLFIRYLFFSPLRPHSPHSMLTLIKMVVKNLAV